MSSKEEEEDNTRFILSLVGLGVSCFIIVIFIAVTNYSIYKKNPNSFLFKPTSSKLANYLYSYGFAFGYVTIFNSLSLALECLLDGNLTILLVFIIYLGSIISLSTLQK